MASRSVLPQRIADAFPRSHSATRRALDSTVVLRSFAPGQTILRQGQESALALVVDGHVALQRTTEDGRQVMFRVASAGSLAPVLPLGPRPAGADAIALTAGLAALWNAGEIRSRAAVDAGLALDVLDQTLSTFEEIVEGIDGLLHQDAQRRVARALRRRFDLFFGGQPISRAYLANLVGTSREMTTRVLRALEARQVVARVGRDRLRLLDPDALAAIADGTR
jgi:CRP-like cAMP-binding protein